MDEGADKRIEAAVAAVERHHLDPEDLDGLVHDQKSAEGSQINNGGLDAQIRYLAGECGMGADAIVAQSDG